jgi:hypothetical protein
MNIVLEAPELSYVEHVMGHRGFLNSPRLSPPSKLPALTLLFLGFTASSGEPETIPAGDVHSVEAVVHALAFVGDACWLLTTKYGQLEPTNLEPEYQSDGLKVIVSFRKRGDLASTCMQGVGIVTLSSISRETN